MRIGTGPELLSDVTLTIPAGVTVTLFGPAGTGKSMLIQIAALARSPSRGEVRVAGQRGRWGGITARALLRRRIGWIEQAPISIEGLAPLDDVALPLRIAGMSRTEARRCARGALDRLGMDGASEEAPHRIAAARATVGNPALLLLDELAAFEGPLLTKLLDEFELLRQAGAGLLVTSRDRHVLRRIPNAHALQMSEGRLRACCEAGAALLGGDAA